MHNLASTTDDEQRKSNPGKLPAATPASLKTEATAKTIKTDMGEGKNQALPAASLDVNVDTCTEPGTDTNNQPDTKAPTIAEQINALTDPSFMTSLARGLAVIKAFSDHRRAMTIAQLSLKTGIPRAAVRRCLYTLKQLGYADSEANNFFFETRHSGAGLCLPVVHPAHGSGPALLK